MSSTAGGPDRPELSGLLDSADVASASSLGAIVARSRHKSMQRLKVVTGLSLILALSGIGVAILRNGTNSSNSGSTVFASNAPSGIAKAPAWATTQRNLGAAPSGLKWASESVGSANAAAPNVLLPAAGSALCIQSGCTGVGLRANAPLTRLFTRTSGDITIRAFTLAQANVTPVTGTASGSPTNPPGVAPSPNTGSGNTGSGNTGSGNTGSGNTGSGNTGVTSPPSTPIAACTMSQQLQVEVSNSGAVGSVTVPLSSTPNSSTGQAFDVVDSSAVGVAEGSPMEVVTVHVGTNVTTVQASFSDGTSDQMSVVDGWAVLVDDAASPLPVTIEALDNTGLKIASASVNNADALAQPEACVVPLREAPLAGSVSPGTPTGAK